MSSLTQLIQRAAKGDADAADRLFTTMYDELRRLAGARLRAGGRDTLLDTSSVVHGVISPLRGCGTAPAAIASTSCGGLDA